MEPKYEEKNTVVGKMFVASLQDCRKNKAGEKENCTVHLQCLTNTYRLCFVHTIYVHMHTLYIDYYFICTCVHKTVTGNSSVELLQQQQQRQQRYD